MNETRDLQATKQFRWVLNRYVASCTSALVELVDTRPHTIVTDSLIKWHKCFIYMKAYYQIRVCHLSIRTVLFLYSYVQMSASNGVSHVASLALRTQLKDNFKKCRQQS